ncbi:MAG: glycosyltransferase family 39 protein, partial [Nitrospinota bacterium]|nr:glycosyltransferase family 39 protein [Nitrospinota bacterium]
QPEWRDQWSLSAEKWLQDRQKWIPIALVIAAVLLRALLFVEASDSPLMATHTNKQSDMFFFDHWGKEVAAGDWLTDQALHPMHFWHIDLAKRYFDMRPEVAVACQEEARTKGITAEKILWNRWLGGKTFHQEPLYAYLIGITYRVFGPDPRAVYIWQMALGVLTTLMLYFISLRLFGPLTALVAGVIALLSATLTWHEITLLRTTLTVFVSVGLVWLALVAEEKKRLQWYAAFGFAAGVALTLQNIYILLVGLIALWFLWPLRRTPRQAGYTAGIIVGFMMIALSPVIARNLAVGAPPLAMVSQGWVFFILANAPDINPSIPINLLSPYTSEILVVTEGKAIPSIVETIKLHDSLFGYFLLLAHKFLIIFSPYPASDNGLGFSYFESHSTSLSIARFHFALLAPLTILCLFAGRVRLFTMAPLLAVMIMMIIPMTAFITLSRYRAPMEAAMIPLAAYGLVWLATRRHGAIILSTSLALFFLLGPTPPPARYKDYGFAAYNFFTPKINAATGAGDWNQAALIYEHWFRYENNFGISSGVIQRDQIKTAVWYGRQSLAYAEVLEKAGNPERSKEMSNQGRQILNALGVKE